MRKLINERRVTRVQYGEMSENLILIEQSTPLSASNT